MFELQGGGLRGLLSMSDRPRDLMALVKDQVLIDHRSCSSNGVVQSGLARWYVCANCYPIKHVCMLYVHIISIPMILHDYKRDDEEALLSDSHTKS